MEDFATKVFTLDRNDNSIITNIHAGHTATVQLNSKQIHLKQPQIQQEQENYLDKQEELAPVKHAGKVREVNPYYSYFPNFYLKELKNSLLVMVIWSIVLALTLGMCGWLAYEIVVAEYVNNWTLLTLIPIVGSIVTLFAVYLVKFLNFRCEAKTINFKDEKVISNNVLKTYKSLKTSFINVNWFSLLSYTINLLMLFVDCVVCFFTYKTKFGDVYTPISTDGNYVYAFVFWFNVALVVITFILHVSLLLSAYIRYSRIDNFYNFPIVSQEDLTLLKKKTNRRDMIIYLAVVGTLGLIVWLIIRTVKKNKKTHIVVTQ